MLAWSEGTDNGHPENQKSWLWRHCGRATAQLLRSPSQTCHEAELKSLSAGRCKTPRWWDAYRKQPAEELSEKSGRCGIAARWGVALAYDWSWWYPSGNRPLQQYLGFTAGHWLWSGSSIRLTAWLQNSKKRAEQVREIDMSRVTAIISALVICIIVCLSWAVNHYRDNAVPTKPSATKM